MPDIKVVAVVRDPVDRAWSNWVQLVDSPRETLDRVSTFLGGATGVARTVPPENVKPYVADTSRHRVLSRVARAGASLGAAMHAVRAPRPPLPVAVRQEVLEPLLPDIALLEEITGESFEDWRGDTSRGHFGARQKLGEAR